MAGLFPGDALPTGPCTAVILRSPDSQAGAEGLEFRGTGLDPVHPVQRPIHGPVGTGCVRRASGLRGIFGIHQHDVPPAESGQGEPGAASATPPSGVQEARIAGDWHGRVTSR